MWVSEEFHAVCELGLLSYRLVLEVIMRELCDSDIQL